MIRLKKKLGHRDKKILIYAILGIVIFAFVSVSFGYTENRLVLNETVLEITGLYGEKIPRVEIGSIELTNKRPSLSRRISGFSTGNRKKGFFATGKGEKIKAIINSQRTPWILIIKKSGEKIYYSSNRESNKNIFKRLEKKFPEASVTE